MSRSHSHNYGGTQNQGNSIGNKSSIRQSKLFRQYESGNDVKDILGTSNLKWKTDVKQGAYNGKVFDHNAPIATNNHQSISNNRKNITNNTNNTNDNYSKQNSNTNDNYMNNNSSQYQQNSYHEQHEQHNYVKQQQQQYLEVNHHQNTKNIKNLPKIPGLSLNENQLDRIRDENNRKARVDGSTTKRLTDDKKQELR